MKIDFKEFIQKIKKIKRIRLKIIISAIVLIILVCGISATSFVLNNRYNPNDKKIIQIDKQDRINVEVPKGAGTSEIAEILQNKGIIGNKEIFKIIAKLTGYDGKLKEGNHFLSKKLDNTEVLKILSQKSVFNPQIMVTFPENFGFRETEEKLYKEKLINKERFELVANKGKFDYPFIKDIPERKHRLEGYLFPETYSFDGKLSEEQIIDIFLKQFNQVFTEEFRNRANALNMTVDQIITLASIIEREAETDDERALIAGVFYNRLHSKIPYLNKLQSCATIQYILMENGGTSHDTVTLEDLKIVSPYNTYMYAGLPIGPICSPGRPSIIAALYPVKTDYLFFVAKNDGSGGHYFSKTYQEHLAAIKKAEKN
ncbi:MAG: endolytic transglycosylase MltG [Clostridia bacterium]|jgi:UPF0755 protein